MSIRASLIAGGSSVVGCLPKLYNFDSNNGLTRAKVCSILATYHPFSSAMFYPVLLLQRGRLPMKRAWFGAAAKRARRSRRTNHGTSRSLRAGRRRSRAGDPVLPECVRLADPEMGRATGLLACD